MIGTERASDYIIFHVGSKLLVLIWNTKHSMGRIIWVEQNIEKTVESSVPNETDVADCHSGISTARTWFPKRVSKGRILDCKVMAENVVMGHYGSAESKENPECSKFQREDIDMIVVVHRSLLTRIGNCAPSS